MGAGDVGEGLQAEGAGVLLVRGPGLHEHLLDGGDDLWSGADGLLDPFRGDFVRGEIGVPGEASEGVEICEGQRRAEPAVAADAGYADRFRLEVH